MFMGKPFARSLHGHMLSVSAVLSLLLEEFWSALDLEEKLMLNLFAATGHNNYAKTCRLYLQSVIALENEHFQIFEQFILSNPTVRHTEKFCSGIWPDLSMEQILMRVLKG